MLLNKYIYFVLRDLSEFFKLTVGPKTPMAVTILTLIIAKVKLREKQTQ